MFKKLHNELLEGFDRDKQSREEYDEIAEDGVRSFRITI